MLNLRKLSRFTYPLRKIIIPKVNSSFNTQCGNQLLVNVTQKLPLVQSRDWHFSIQDLHV
jgi:hypothetical protein